jgi:hypothetical protein
MQDFIKFSGIEELHIFAGNTRRYVYAKGSYGGVISLPDSSAN